MLSDPGCRRALCSAVATADRLVLLGDVLELRESPLREVLPAACAILAELGSALPEAAPVVLLAGNHDHRLLAPWLERRPREVAIGHADEVEVDAADALARLTAALGARRTRVLFPGVRLREDVWASHGHYGDRHTTVPILERVAAGAMARLNGEAPGGPAAAEDYEAALAPVYAWIDARAEHGAGRGRPGRALEGSERAWLSLSGRSGRGSARARALRAGFPLAIAALNRAGIGPLRADLGSAALRRGPLVAMGEVQRRLGVTADWMVFGHTHRAGPLADEDPADWVTPGGARLLNTGCWVREPSFVGPDPARSPYRAGFAAWLDSAAGTPPELVNLLD